MSVITTFELHYFFAPGKSARQANRGHGRFGAAADEAHEFNRRHDCANFFCESRFKFSGSAKGQSERRTFLDRANDIRMRMTQNHRPPRSHVIDVAFAVGGEDVSAARALNENGLTADGFECAHRRVDAAWNVATSFGKEGQHASPWL